MAHLIVIGGGITGVTSAYVLARQGHQVTLILNPAVHRS